MTHKTRWISFWVTLAYWLGSAWGCANTASQDPLEVLLEETSHQEQVAQDHVLEEAAPSPQTHLPEDADILKALPISETVPSLRGLDRSKWPRIVVGPASGSTPHSPILFQDLPADLGTPKDIEPHYAELDLEVVRLPAEDFSRVNKNATVGRSQLLDALGDAQAQNWSAQNGTHLLLQPLKVSLDLLTAPFHSIDGADPSDPIAELILAPAHFVQGLFQSGAKEVADPFQPELPEDEYEDVVVPQHTPDDEPTDLPNDQSPNVSADALDDTPNDAPVDTLDEAPDDTPQDVIQQNPPQVIPDDTPGDISDDTPRQDDPPIPMK